MTIYNEQCTVPFASVDQSDRLSIASTFDFFQEAAINHAEVLGVGREAMKQSGQVWILSRLSVFMKSRPRYREKILIRTWPRGANKLFAVRDYDIHLIDHIKGHEDGPGRDEVLVKGRSSWLIVDIEKRRPVRPQAVAESLPFNEGINALPGINVEGNDPCPSLKEGEYDTEQAIVRRASYSDIDYNGHVNNTRYIQWIQDLLDPEILETAQQLRLDINYLAEVRYGENIKLFCSPIKTSVPSEEALQQSGQFPLPCKRAFSIEGRREQQADTQGNIVPVFRAELYTS